MIHEVTIANLVMIMTPVFSAIFCVVMILLKSSVWDRLKRTNMRRSLLIYYMMILCNWSSILVISFFPDSYIFVWLPVTFSIIIVPLMLYRIIFILTRIKSPDRFPVAHYFLPAALFLLTLAGTISMIFLKDEEKILEIITPARTIMISVSLRFVFGLVYSTLSILRYRKYRRHMSDYSSNLEQGTVAWLGIFLALWISFLIVPLFPVLLSIEELLIPIILLFLQNILLCFNIIRGNFVLTGKEPIQEKETKKDERREIRKSLFEKYIEEKKPYLDPNLTIVEVANALRTNRSYVSGFINSTYGMNFSQHVNEYRLKELEEILQDPRHAEKSNIEKITLAGFGSYQSYRRAVQMQEKRKTLKAFE